MSKTFYMGADDAEFGWFGSHIGHFISNAAKVAGKEIGHATHAMQSATGAVTGAIGKIPIVGAPVHTVFSAAYNATMAPLNNTVAAAIHGKRLDKAVLDTLHAEVHSVKDVAPYAKMVVSMVPGVGTGISAAMGAGLALANGQPIDKALLAGAIGALPGGAIAHAAASAAAAGVEAAARGEKIDVHSAAGTLMNSLPIPAGAKEALQTGSHVVGTVAGGKAVTNTVSDAMVQQAIKTLPPEAQKAYQSGLALGAAAVAQSHRAKELVSPAVLNKLTESGIQSAKTVPAIGEARKLAGPGVKGFDIAQGLLQQHSRPFDIMHIRNGLTGPDLMGFDMGLATRIGLVSQPPRGKLSPAAQAGRAVAQGVQGMPHPENKAKIMTALTAHPSASVGANLAVHQATILKEAWYVRAAHALGLDLGHHHAKV
jgi:hypothetical protein